MGIKIAEHKGHTKEIALATEVVGFDVTTLNGSNATQAWIKDGKPTMGTDKFKTFAAEQLKKKTKLKEGLGCYVVIEAGVADSRERPYKILTVPTDGPRKFNRVYQVVEAEFDTKIVKTKEVDEEGVEKIVETLTVVGVKSIGVVVDGASKKSEALAKAKEWVIATKRSYILNILMEVSVGEPVAAYAVYTPSVSAKEGTYIAFGVEA